MPTWATAVIAFIASIIGSVIVIVYNAVTSRPRIKGRLCSVAIGTWITGEIGKWEKTYTFFMPMLFLTNARRGIVYILEYELEVDLGQGFNKYGIERIFGIENDLRNKNDFNFETPQYYVKISKPDEKLLYTQKSPINYATPKFGLLFFASERDRDFFEGKVKRYRLTCKDIFGGTHQIEQNAKKEMNLYVMAEHFGLELKRKLPAA